MPQLTMTDLFEECQKGIQSHGKLIKSFLKIYQSMDLEIFWVDFIHHAKYSMVVYRREPAVERTMDFMAKFSTSLLAPNEEKEEKNESSDEEVEEMHPFLLKIFSFCLEHHKARDKGVRFRCCQMINKLLNTMGEDAQIDEDLYGRIYECMLQRLRDKFPNVRIQAVLALGRLQDPHDLECPIINAYLFLLGCDTNADVRRAVLGMIAASTKTLPAILERTRDVKDIVRKLAYHIISEKVHIRAFSIAQRVRLLHEGLHDRSDLVKDACASRVVQSWLRLFEGNILELLKALDVENAVETSELTLKTLFKKTPAVELVANFDLLNDDLVLPIEELTSESVLYWRCMVEYLASLGTESDEQLDKILPSGTAFAQFMNTVLRHMCGEENVDIQLRNEFILQQLLSIADVIDVSDQVRRNHMLKLIRDMLMNEDVSYSLVKPLIELFTKLSSSGRPEQERVNNLIEIISDIRMPIATLENTRNQEEQRKIDLQLASVRVELNELREELDQCIANQDYTRAATVKSSISELDQTKINLLNEAQQPMSQDVRTEKTDAKTLMKCLSITSEMLQRVSFTGLTPSLQELITSLILPGITNADPAVRNVAVRCLGLCCLMDKQTASKHLLLFMQMSQMDVEGVKLTALRVMFDILHTFGLDAFGVSSSIDANTDEDNEKEDADKSAELFNDSADEADKQTEKDNRATSILTALISLLDSKSSDIRSLAAEGLAKLMLCGRVMSHKLLSRLLLLWYNPVTEDDNNLRHCLGAFFPIFAFAGQANQSVVEECFMMTLNTLFNAPATSPLAGVDVNNVAELLVQLTNPALVIGKQTQPTTQESCHDNIAVTICNEIISEPNSFNVRTLCRILTLLQINPSNYTALKQLLTLTENLLKEVKDKQCVKMVEKFHKTVRALLIAAKQNPLIGTPGPLPGATDADATEVNDEEKEPETHDVTTRTERTSSQDSESMLIDESGLIDPNNSRAVRKAKKGKKLLHSMNETPVSQRHLTRTNQSTDATTVIHETSVVAETPAAQTSHATTESETNKSQSSDSDADADNVTSANQETYASPALVRRSRRSRRQKKTVLQNVNDARKNIEELLSESDTQSDGGEPARMTRGSRKRTKQGDPRGPLNDIRNELA